MPPVTIAVFPDRSTPSATSAAVVKGPAGDDVAALAEAALSGLSSLVQRYDDPSTPYRAVRRPNFKYDYDQYAQLARVAEWSAHVDDENGT